MDSIMQLRFSLCFTWRLRSSSFKFCRGRFSKQIKQFSASKFYLIEKVVGQGKNG